MNVMLKRNNIPAIVIVSAVCVLQTVVIGGDPLAGFNDCSDKCRSNFINCMQHTADPLPCKRANEECMNRCAATKSTVPSTSTSTPVPTATAPVTPMAGPQQGVAAVAFYNCRGRGVTLHIWVHDLTTDTDWHEQGSLAFQGKGNSCPAQGAQPLVVQLQNGHSYDLIASDPDGVGCNGQGVLSCAVWVNQGVIVGNTQGPTSSVTVN
jgi:hypothetical protein